MSKDEAIKKAMEEAKAAEGHSARSRARTLAENLRTSTGGKVSLPMVNLNGIALIEEELGGLQELDLSKVSNLRVIVWALLHQDVEDVLDYTPEQRKSGMFEVGKTLTLGNLQDYVEAVTRAMELEVGNGTGSNRKGRAK